MTKIKDILAYFCKKYPYPNELSKARLTKMVYLADWKSAQNCQKPLTSINWIFNKFGPYVNDIISEVQKEDIFELETLENRFGGSKGIIKMVKSYEPNLTDQEKNILKQIISDTEDKYWDNFIEYIYSTYPIKVSNRFDTLDLVQLARKENESPISFARRLETA